MTVTAIQSHDNKNNNSFLSMKKATAATIIGAATLGGKEVYNTRKTLLEQKQSYKTSLKYFYDINKSLGDAIKSTNEKDLSRAIDLEKLMPLRPLQKNMQNIINEYGDNIKGILLNIKNTHKEEIKNIKETAPRKIALKALKGAGLVLGVIGGVLLGEHLINKNN